MTFLLRGATYDPTDPQNNLVLLGIGFGSPPPTGVPFFGSDLLLWLPNLQGGLHSFSLDLLDEWYWQFPLPNDPAFEGLKVVFQAAWQASFSHGVRAVIGL